MNISLSLILDEGKILIGKIKQEKLDEYGELQYVFPCESVQEESNAEEELIEEVKRQTNLDISIVKKIGERVHPSTQNYTYYFHCRKNSDQKITVTSDTDFESFIWCNLNELESYMPTLFGDVKDYLDNI